MGELAECNVLDIVKDVEVQNFNEKEFYKQYVDDYKMPPGDIPTILHNVDTQVRDKKKKQNRGLKGQKPLELQDILNGKDVTLKFGNVGKSDYNLRRFTYMMFMVAFDNGMDVLTIMKELLGANKFKIYGIEMCYWKYPMKACVACISWYYMQNVHEHRRILNTLLNQKNEKGIGDVLSYINKNTDAISEQVKVIRNLEMADRDPTTMKGIRVARFGHPGVLAFYKNLPKPVPKEDQILINVKASGVNPVDTYIRAGMFPMKPDLPYVPGKDGAGVVVQVGKNVKKVKEGDRVWFSECKTGSYAEFCICEADSMGELPDDFEFEDGAMIGIPYRTAYRALFQLCKLKKGMTVLIHGATGGVGIAALQMCKLHEANVIATAGSADGERMLRNMGVTTIYNHRSDGYMSRMKSNEEKIDIILEMLANVNLEEDLKAIAPNGKIVVIGCRGSIEIDPRNLMGIEASIIGCAIFNSTAAEKAEQYKYIQQRLGADSLKPLLWKNLRLNEARRAHKEIIDNKGTKGQIVLKLVQ